MRLEFNKIHLLVVLFMVVFLILLGLSAEVNYIEANNCAACHVHCDQWEAENGWANWQCNEQTCPKCIMNDGGR